MRESLFVKNNSDKWGRFEKLMADKRANPDSLAELFVEITDDLSYARTNYPQSKTTFYLNQLASRIHQSIYKNKKEKRSRFWMFWIYEIPLIFKGLQKDLLYSFIIFSISIAIGALSAAYDDTYVRLILGDAYVNQTLENIENGQPMNIYGSMSEVPMFIFITYNNVKVSFTLFGLSVLFPVIGALYVLINNGIMLGAFQYFFIEKGLFVHSASTIWIHGTLEISAIVIAGAVGLALGKSILFPKTYTRIQSFQRAASIGVKVIMGLVPIFITAGFLEGFVTRYEFMPLAIKLFIIFSSLFFIIYYFILYPNRLHKRSEFLPEEYQIKYQELLNQK